MLIPVAIQAYVSACTVALTDVVLCKSVSIFFLKYGVLVLVCE